MQPISVSTGDRIPGGGAVDAVNEIAWTFDFFKSSIGHQTLSLQAKKRECEKANCEIVFHPDGFQQKKESQLKLNQLAFIIVK